MPADGTDSPFMAGVPAHLRSWHGARPGHRAPRDCPRPLPCYRAGTPKGPPMIPRYSRPEMVAIWSPETRFRIWFEIEAHACDALAELGVIPKEAAKTIWEKGGAAKFDVDAHRRDRARGPSTTSSPSSPISPSSSGPDARFIHQGMTSSDVLDTCFAVQLVRATDILLADIDALLAALKRRAFEHKDTAPSAAATASMPSRRPSASSWRRPMPSSPRCRERLVPRAKRSPPAPSRARSAPSPTSIRASRSMSPRRWA